MGMLTYCPHCKRQIEFVPDIHGKTVVVDADVRDAVIDYPSGFVKVIKARLIHKCEHTGELGHVVT